MQLRFRFAYQISPIPLTVCKLDHVGDVAGEGRAVVSDENTPHTDAITNTSKLKMMDLDRVWTFCFTLGLKYRRGSPSVKENGNRWMSGCSPLNSGRVGAKMAASVVPHCIAM